MGNSFSSKSAKHEENKSLPSEAKENAVAKSKSKKRRKKSEKQVEKKESNATAKKKSSFTKRFQENPTKKKKKRTKTDNKDDLEFQDSVPDNNQINFPKIVISTPSDVEASLEQKTPEHKTSLANSQRLKKPEESKEIPSEESSMPEEAADVPADAVKQADDSELIKREDYNPTNIKATKPANMDADDDLAKNEKSIKTLNIETNNPANEADTVLKDFINLADTSEVRETKPNNVCYSAEQNDAIIDTEVVSLISDLLRQTLESEQADAAHEILNKHTCAQHDTIDPLTQGAKPAPERLDILTGTTVTLDQNISDLDMPSEAQTSTAVVDFPSKGEMDHHSEGNVTPPYMECGEDRLSPVTIVMENGDVIHVEACDSETAVDSCDDRNQNNSSNVISVVNTTVSITIRHLT